MHWTWSFTGAEGEMFDEEPLALRCIINSRPEAFWLATTGQKDAQTRNRTGGPTMATLDFTTKPFARVDFSQMTVIRQG